jgi:hypothetical protein
MDRNWQINPALNGFNGFDVLASVLVLMAVLIITSLALAVSTRFNIIATLSVCIGVFLIGLVTDYLFGRFADTSLLAKFCYFILPNLQIFWISDAIYESNTVPLKYITITAAYALCYITAMLLIATALFQRRQVG